MLVNAANSKIEVLYHKAYSAIIGNAKWSSEDDAKFKYAKKAKENGFSFYGLRNARDFFAEAIAQYYGAGTQQHSEITKAVSEILKGEE